jgi:hypothetical protein
MDLVQFLRDRYKEAAAKAESAREGGEGRWGQGDAERHPGRIEDERGEPVVYDEGSPSEAQAAHIVENDPARVLADIEAKRQIIELHKSAKLSYLPSRERGCVTCSTAQTWDAQANEANCQTLRLLAAPYGDHPDYRDEWRP